MTQVTSVTVIQYPPKNRWWGFTRMGKQLDSSNIEGLSFCRLLGSGAGAGFSVLPDLSTYVLFAVWENEQNAQSFFEKHEAFDELKKRATKISTVFMHAIKANGLWNGGNPFNINKDQEKHDGMVAVLTRATIRPAKVLSFWSNVGAVSKDILNAKGLIYAKGVGEYPLFMQATLSFWEDISYVQQYAYSRKAHAKVITKTRQLDWYSEELFANFSPYRSFGDMGLLPKI